MSGLCAVVRWDGMHIDPRTIERMTDATRHRGHSTTHTTPHVHLAHQSHRPEKPPQPDTLHHLTITASTRIDNRDELLGHLQPLLETPDPTDARLILAAHLQWGPHAPAHLIGDYAYAIYDHHARTLYAARDPMSMRPLYYHHTARSTHIASEIQQLLATGDVPCEIHEPAVARYLIGEFGAPEETFYRDVHSLPAGHALQITAGGLRTWRFWEVDPGRREHYPREEDYAERFRDLMVQAVQDRLREPGPRGLLLSGGVDSGSIGAIAGWLHENGRTPERIHTYSWAFETLLQCDERHLSRLLVERYGLPSHDLAAEASAPLERYPDHGPHRDEPYIGVYQPLLEAGLATARADGMQALWSGDRGDLLAGAWAPDAFGLVRCRQWDNALDVLRDDARLPGRGWLSSIGSHLLVPGLRTVAGRLRRPLRRPRPSSRGPRLDPRRPPWLRSDLHERTGVDPARDLDPEPPVGMTGYARRMRYQLVFTSMHMRGMLWSERTHAAFGLGFIDAWSDRRLAEFVLAIPQAMLDRPRELRKRLVREAMRGIMPEELRLHAAKIVPSPLFQRVLRHDGVATVRALLQDMEAERRGYLDGEALRAHYDQIVAGGRAHPTLWWALTLEMWLRRYWR